MCKRLHCSKLIASTLARFSISGSHNTGNIAPSETPGENSERWQDSLLKIGMQGVLHILVEVFPSGWDLMKLRRHTGCSKINMLVSVEASEYVELSQTDHRRWKSALLLCSDWPT
jgi:hypothetical protein